MEYLYLLLCLAAIVFSADWLVAGAVTTKLFTLTRDYPFLYLSTW